MDNNKIRLPGDLGIIPTKRIRTQVYNQSLNVSVKYQHLIFKIGYNVAQNFLVRSYLRQHCTTVYTIPVLTKIIAKFYTQVKNILI